MEFHNKKQKFINLDWFISEYKILGGYKKLPIRNYIITM